MTKIKKWCY